MQAELTQPDVMTELERAVRRCAALRTQEFVADFHYFLREARGVIHVGAHAGQERDLYGDLPVVWIEALEQAYDVLRERIADKPNQRALLQLVADGKRYKFGVANNAGQSSSIYDFKLHEEMWPDVGYVASVEIKSETLRTIIDYYKLDLDVYDTLVLDVQGAELLVLQGAGDYLSRFKWIQAEAADFEAYSGGCQLKDLDAFLTRAGFVREQLNCGMSTPGVGNYYEALYRRGTMPVVEIGTNGRLTLEEIEAARRCALPPEMREPVGTTTPQPLRLNLGAGHVQAPGFTNLDHKTGQEIYPLPHADGAVEEVLASHVLEHFPYRQVGLVLSEWVRVLKPGGKLRLAVPDAEDITRRYHAGEPINIQAYLMGGQIDEDDFHKCLFDRESLTELMITCGLERVGPWDAEHEGASTLPWSLNLQGFKPSTQERTVTGVRACMSTPRFGPLLHPRCSQRAFSQLGIDGDTGQSCFWHQKLSNQIEDAIKHQDCEFVLTLDFDTIFCAGDVLELYRLLKACPDVDAVFPLQSKRHCEDVLFSLTDNEGNIKPIVTESDLSRNLLPANTGHFGLTLFRADSLRKFPRPWMVPTPNESGLWSDGHTDADIDFWRRFKAAGMKCCLAPRVVVGHLEEVVKWPGKDLKPVYQSATDYEELGIPAAAAR